MAAGPPPELLETPPPAPEISDAELVQRSLQGDEDAFRGIVARYQRKAFWIAFHVVGTVEEARDVAQESFLRVFRGWRASTSASFYTWFYRIVMNLAIDALRKRQPSAVLVEDLGSCLPTMNLFACRASGDQAPGVGRARQAGRQVRVGAGAARDPRHEFARDRADSADHACHRSVASPPRPADLP